MLPVPANLLLLWILRAVFVFPMELLTDTRTVQAHTVVVIVTKKTEAHGVK